MGTRAFIIAVFVVTVLSGCSHAPEAAHPAASPAVRSVESSGLTGREVKAVLYSQLDEWEGVGYRAGGLGKSGVDCSGFVHLTFEDRFGLKIPRSTELLSSQGRQVGRAELKAGDLVFFKTRPKVRHVGIYLENGRFLHASKSKGVMVSRLSSPYWRSRYWQARRVLPVLAYGR